MAKRLYLSIAILVSLFLGACQPTPTAQPANQDMQNGSVGNIRVTTVQPSESLIKTETFPLPNCGGTGEIRQTLGSTASITKNVTLSGKATVRGGGEAGIPETVKLKLEIEIEAAYQKAYESANSRLDTIDMPAAAGTHVVYDIGWYEQVFSSIVQYSINEQVYEAPYVYKLQVPKLDNSHQVSCGTSTKSTESSNNVSTPEVPKPTSTPIIIATQKNTGLSLNEWYTSGNISLVAEKVEFVQNGMYITFKTKNVGVHDISFNYSTHNINVTDNLGQNYVIDRASVDNSSLSIKPGDIEQLHSAFSYTWEFHGDYTNMAVEYLTIIVTDLSAIERAEWTIPVYH